MKDFDIIIIGGGPAGISAGIYAYRAGMKVLVLDAQNSTLKQAKVISNYYGVENISGEDLIAKGVNQYISLGGVIKFEQVVRIKKDFIANTFIVKSSIETYQSKAIILCTGSEKKKSLPGLEKYEGANVSSCAICDGFFYKGKIVAVIGDKEFAFSECEELSRLAAKTYLVTNGGKVECNIKNVEVIDTAIIEFKGDASLNKISFADGKEIEVDGCFVALGNLSSFEIAKQLGILQNNNRLVVDKSFMTNVPGVFAAGDVIGGLLQVAKAVSDGAQAGLEATRYIKILEIDGKTD